MSLEERFAKILREVEAELDALKSENAACKRTLRELQFASEQSTHCGVCNKLKHTPWKDDEYGYICVNCLVGLKDAEISKLKLLVCQLSTEGGAP